ncbi:MAG: hypothetical protein ACKVIS_05085 [Pseudomonadales bacterium]
MKFLMADAGGKCNFHALSSVRFARIAAEHGVMGAARTIAWRFGVVAVRMAHPPASDRLRIILFILLLSDT